MTGALLAPPDAHEGTACGHAVLFSKPTPPHDWARGNGEYCQEVRRAVEVIRASVHAHLVEEMCARLRRDGLSGIGAVLADLGALPVVMRCNVSGLAVSANSADPHARARRSAGHRLGTSPGPHAL